MGWYEENVKFDPNAKKNMRIRMVKMGGNEENPVKKNLEGTIDKIDDLGTLHVIWDDNRYFGIIPGLDEYELLPPSSEQIGFDVFESEDFKLSKAAKKNEMGKAVSKKFKRELGKVKPKPTDINIKLENSEDLEETMTAGGGGGLAGASGYAYTPKLESKIIKAKDLMKEETTTNAITATVDFVVANLLGWGDKSDMSPPWPSPTKKAENGELEDWWWQKIPTYNGGVITDPYAKTNDTWNDDILDSNVNNDMTQFQKDVYSNPKKYKQSVITIDKGFDLNISPANNDWKFSLQKGIDLKSDKNYKESQNFRNRHYSRTIKKEDIIRFTDNLINEAKNKEDKKDKVHTVKWDRCVKAVEEKNKKNGTNYKPEAVCTSSLGYKDSIKKSHRKKEDIEETTTFGSVFGGGFPVTPMFAAKKGKHIPSKKPIWKGGQIVQKINESKLLDEINKIKWVKGGKYVKIKDRCAKYNNKPWCSQGAIDNPLELSDNTFENIKNISNKTGLSEDFIVEKIKNIVKENTYQELSFMDKLKIKLAGISEDQVIYNLNNDLPIDWKGTKEAYYEKMEPKSGNIGSN